MIKTTMRILRENTAAVIIDIQQKLFPHMKEKDVLEQNTIRLLKGLNAMNIPVIATQQYTKGLGPTIESVRSLLSREITVEKSVFSCCDEPVFIEKLKSLNKKFIILAGIEAHVCILQTAVDLVSGNFIPVIVSDCVSSRKAKDRDCAINRMYAEGSIITTFESVLMELCRTSRSDDFKKISAVIK